VCSLSTFLDVSYLIEIIISGFAFFFLFFFVCFLSFLNSRSHRYVALNTLSKVVSVDSQAIQRHRSTIVDCLKDHDISIRRRALELVYALVNETNIRMLVRELLAFLMSSDLEFRSDLTAKICMVTEK